MFIFLFKQIIKMNEREELRKKLREKINQKKNKSNVDQIKKDPETALYSMGIEDPQIIKLAASIIKKKQNPSKLLDHVKSPQK